MSKRFIIQSKNNFSKSLFGTKKQSDINLLMCSAARKQPTFFFFYYCVIVCNNLHLEMTRYASSPCGSLTHYILYWRRLILSQQAQKWLAAPLRPDHLVLTQNICNTKKLGSTFWWGDGEKLFSCLLTDCSLQTCTSNIPVKAESGECSAAGFSKCVRACRWWGKDDRMQPLCARAARCGTLMCTFAECKCFRGISRRSL